MASQNISTSVGNDNDEQPQDSAPRSPAEGYAYPAGMYEQELEQVRQDYPDQDSDAPTKPEPEQAPQFDPRLVDEANRVGLTDLSGVRNNNDLTARIQQTRFETSQKLSQQLGIDLGDLAQYFQDRSNRGRDPETGRFVSKQPPEAPAQAPEPEPEPAPAPAPAPEPFSLSEEERENLTPGMEKIIQRVVDHFAKQKTGIPRETQEKIQQLEQALGAVTETNNRRQEQEMGQAYDRAAEASGLTSMLGMSPSAALSAGANGNNFHPGVHAWAGFVKEFLEPTYTRLLQSGEPDAEPTVHKAMAEAAQQARQEWSRRAGGEPSAPPPPPQQPQQPQQPQYAAPPPGGVIRSDARSMQTAPYDGAQTFANEWENIELERQRWAANNGHNPYHRRW